MASTAQADPELRLDTNLNWHIDAPWFGGISGFEVSPDGRTAILITDQGHLATVAIVREQEKIVGLRLLHHTPLRHRNGLKLRGKQSADAEGLDVSPGGTAHVSFERGHRVAVVNLASGKTTPIPGHIAFEKFQPNSGMEALARHPNGTLFTLPERSGARGKAFDLFVFSDGDWRISHRIPRRGPFLPVGADFDADGLFYLLERAATPLGFRSRIRRFDLRADIFREQTLLTTLPNRFDNLEAISVWRDQSGANRLTLVSDDNFLRIQRTQIVEFILTE